MARPLQQVKVYAIQNRRGSDRVKLPYVVRYTIDVRHRSKSFRTKADLELAVAAALQTGLPVVSQRAALQEQEVEEFVPAHMVGVNCVSGEQAVAAVKRLGALSPLPRSAFPSGGLPGKEILPGAFAESIRALVAAGARLVGGCCGAGPEHIRAAALLGGVR